MEKNLKYIERIDTYENESEYVKRCFTAMRMLAANPNIVRNTEDDNSPTLERNYILSMVYQIGKSDFLRENTDIVLGSSSYFVGGEDNKLIPILDESAIKTSKDLHFADKGNKIEIWKKDQNQLDFYYKSMLKVLIKLNKEDDTIKLTESYLSYVKENELDQQEYLKQEYNNFKSNINQDNKIKSRNLKK